jgi:DnaJ-class molecular chaperone
MADDPYSVLGVPRSATEKQIRSAFLKLAKTSHPDLHPGDAGAEARFKAATAANDLLSDLERRARFDRGEIDAGGHETPPQPRYREHADGAAGARYDSGFGMHDEDMDDVLSGLFGGRGRRAPRAGRDRQYSLSVPFLDAVRGSTQRIVLPDGGNLDVRIPAGLEDGQTLRLRGKGDPGAAGMPAGDALIEVAVVPHPVFVRVGRDIYFDVPISITEAVLGARIAVPTISGAVTLAVPPGAETGTKLRLRGRGVPESGKVVAGDAFATLRIMQGPADPGLADFLRDRTDAPVWNPRGDLEKHT